MISICRGRVAGALYSGVIVRFAARVFTFSLLSLEFSVQSNFLLFVLPVIYVIVARSVRVVISNFLLLPCGRWGELRHFRDVTKQQERDGLDGWKSEKWRKQIQSVSCNTINLFNCKVCLWLLLSLLNVYIKLRNNSHSHCLLYSRRRRTGLNYPK